MTDTNLTPLERLKNSLIENQYIVPSMEIYGGARGFHDYGVLGIRVKNKLIDMWRNFFLFEEEIDEVETPLVMPYNVLKASGHVDRFQDYIVFDGEGNCYRADHMLEQYYEEANMPSLKAKVSSWNAAKMTMEINKFGIIDGGPSEEDPEVKKKVQVLTKNLMYEVATTNSKNDAKVDFLRPELAQGIFVNFKSVLDFTKRDLPFGIAQVGKSYRKEISPTPFTRMREFTQAEIEFFIDPQNPTYPKVEEYMDLVVPMLPSKTQRTGLEEVTMWPIKSALESKLINHQVMAYFIARIYLFAKKIGLKDDKIRFRQHMPQEMAHYANQCWDLECLVSGKWLECVGIADRGSYDLEAHSMKSKAKLTCRRPLKETQVKKTLRAKLNMKLVGQKYKENSPKIMEYFNNLSQERLLEIKNDIFKEKESMYVYIDDTLFIINKNMISVIDEVSKNQYEEFYPHTIEPSIGIDRLLYAVFEQNFWTREEDDQRIVLALPDCLTPYDIAVFPLQKKPEMVNLAAEVRKLLRTQGIYCYNDASNVSIGKRYCRLDEMGIKYAITVDPGSLKDKSVTIRERDSKEQIRVPIDKLPKIIPDASSYFS